MPPAVEVRPHDVEEVIVHADDARHHGVAAKIQNGRVPGGRHVGAPLDRANLSPLDYNILIFNRRRSGAVNNPHMRENNFGGLHAHEFLYRLRQLRILGRCG